MAGEATSYFLLVDHNDLRSSVEAHLLRAPVTTSGNITVSADEIADLTAFDEASTVSWEGKGAVIVTNVMLSSAKAYIEDGDVSGADVTVSAANTSTMDATATSKIESWDNLSFVLAFNSIGWKSSNILFNTIDAILGDPLISSAFNGKQAAEATAYIRDSNVEATGNLAVTATQASSIVATVGNENVAEAIIDISFGSSWQAKGVSGGAVVASNKVNTTASAFIEFTTTPGTIDAADVLVSASDAASIASTSTVIQVAITKNDLSGIADVVAGISPNDYDWTTRSGEVTLTEGDRVRVAPDYSLALGDPGSIYVYHGADALIDLGTVDFKAAPTTWEKVVLTTAEQIANFYPNIGNLFDSDARAIGILIVLNDVRADVSAWIDNAEITGGSVEVLATEDAEIAAEATSTVEASGGSFKGGGTVQAINGQIATNLILSKANAWIEDSDIDVTGNVGVEARNTSSIDASIHMATASGDLAVSIALAFNTIGWASQNFLFNAIDAILGDSLISSALYPNAQAVTHAWISNSSIEADGGVSVEAYGNEQINATISNAADSAASALYGANGKAVGGIIAMNKVRSSVQAYIEDTPVTAGGDLDVKGQDAAGIFSNVKMVSSSVTSNDGGVGVLQSEINNFVSFQYLNTEGLRAPKFGERVRIAPGSIVVDFSSDDGSQTIANGNKVQLSDDYGSYRLTSKSGKRLLVTGDNIKFEAGYGTGGVDGVVYRYLGGNGRVDLGAENFGNTLRWAKLGGEAGATYMYVGSGGTLDLRNIDYTTADWQQVGGVEGAIYQWMGADVDVFSPIDLSTANYLDLRYWKRVLETSLLPSGINVTDSNSTSVGWIVVYNDVRTDVDAIIRRSPVTAPSVDVEAQLTAFIRSTADISGTSSGGSAFNNGTSLALGFVIATNIILSSADAEIDESPITTTTGGVTVHAENLSQIDAEALNAIQSAGEGAGVTLAFNSIGWKSQNILFNLIDTILGDPLIATAFGNAQPAETTALIHNSRIDSHGDVTVTAINEALINAVVSNDAETTVVVITGSTSLAIGVAIASNMVNATSRAGIEFDATGAYTPSPSRRSSSPAT